MHVYTYTHAHTYSAEELGYPSWGTQTITFKRTHNYWVLGIHCWVRGASGQFHLGEIHLSVPLASQPVPHISSLPASVLCSLYSNKRLSLAFSFPLPEWGNVLGNSCRGSNLVFEKETVKKKNVFAGLPKWSEPYLSEWGGRNVFTQQENAGWVSAVS